MNLWQRKNLIVGLAITLFFSIPIFLVFNQSNVKESQKKTNEIFALTDNLDPIPSQLSPKKLKKDSKNKHSKDKLSTAPEWGSSKAIGASSPSIKKRKKKKRKLSNKIKVKKPPKSKKKTKSKKKILKEKKAPDNKIAETKTEKTKNTPQTAHGAGGGAIQQSPTTSSEKENNLPQSFTQEGDDPTESWKKYLINNPSYTKLMEFIKAHNTGIISNVVYFSVSEDMMNNKTKQIREYGVAALGAYSHPDSFALLTNQLDSETQKTIVRKINGYLAAYINFNHLSSLIASIGDPSTLTRHQVAIYLKRSVEYNLSGRGRPQDPETLKRYKESYSSTLTPLNTAINQENEAQVRSAMQTAKTQIETLTSGRDIAFSVPQ